MPPQPEPGFFLDRWLGRRVAENLRSLGWAIHHAVDHFPNDAQDVPDEDRLRYGLDRGWSPICKDGRIKGRQVERAPVEDHRAVLFYLDNQRLVVDEMVHRIHRAQRAIYRVVAQGGPRAYAIGANGIRRTWP